MNDANSFVGAGWHWPLTTDQTGAVALVRGTTELEQAMYLILSTDPGERPMRPEFGCRLRQFVFASGDATTAGLIAAEVRARSPAGSRASTSSEVDVSRDARRPGDAVDRHRLHASGPPTTAATSSSRST